MFGPAVTRQEKFFRLERPFTTRDVRSRFRRASLQWHPDQNPHRRERAREMFVKIVQKKDFLMELMEKYGGILHPPQEKNTSNLVDAVHQFVRECERREREHRAYYSRVFKGETYGIKTVVLNVLLKKHLQELHDDLGLFYSMSERKSSLMHRLKKETWDTLNCSFHQKHKDRIRHRLEI